MRKMGSFLLSTAVLALVFVLVTGCYKPAAPDVTATPVAGAAAAETEEAEEGTPDIAATGQAESERATQTAQAGAETPTEPPATATPTFTPTPSASPTSPALTATPTAAATTATETPAPSQETTHVVQRGENLFRIALRYDTTVEAIASANGIANPARIYAGQRLVIPVAGGAQPKPSPGGESTYVVQPGDNLFRIALRYNMSYFYLAEYNGIANPSNIHVGQKLRIPSR